MMNATTATILVIVIVVVIAIVVVVLVMRRGRRLDANRVKAAEIRQSAQDDAFAAREGEAKAARAAAAAKQAEVDAERLRRDAAARDEEANAARERAHEQLNKADSIDPDVNGRGRDAADVREGVGMADAREGEAIPMQPPVVDNGAEAAPPNR